MIEILFSFKRMSTCVFVRKLKGVALKWNVSHIFIFRISLFPYLFFFSSFSSFSTKHRQHTAPVSCLIFTWDGYFFRCVRFCCGCWRCWWCCCHCHCHCRLQCKSACIWRLFRRWLQQIHTELFVFFRKTDSARILNVRARCRDVWDCARPLICFHIFSSSFSLIFSSSLLLLLSLHLFFLLLPTSHSPLHIYILHNTITFPSKQTLLHRH